MRLYLVRHGKAEFGPDDAARPLSARGRADIEAMAKHLASMQLDPPRILHSGLARARETAEILSQGRPVEPLAGVEPWGDVKAFATTVQDWHTDTMVCGHEPFMALAASLLLCGDTHGHPLVVKTGTVMALERGHTHSSWHLRWMLTPRMVRGPHTEENA